MKELIIKDYPKSIVTESIKNIKTNLRFSNVDKKLKTILVTSSVSGEGKSFFSANLAASYAEAGFRVLLIDCDLRRGRQHELLELKGYTHKGLSNLLIDDDWENHFKEYINKTDVFNLFLLGNGTTPPNPNELLESNNFENTIDILKKTFDIIVLDAPPVTGLSDALIISRLADAVIILARAESTTFEMLENTKKSLETVNANIAGVVLNGVDKNYSSIYNGHYGYYANK